MVPYERHKRIEDLLQAQEVVSLAQLKEALPEVSESTLKRDLRELEEQGALKRVRGGAAKVQGAYETPMTTKATLHTAEKERIARYAADLVRDGDVIFIDSSSTTVPILRHLGGKKVTVVTASVRGLQALGEAQSVILLGGEYSPRTDSVVGAFAESMLGAMYFDIAFIGASGFSPEGGITTPDFRESTKKQILCKNSRTAYFLMDGSKAGVRTLSKAVELADANLITDRENEYLSEFASYHIAL